MLIAPRPCMTRIHQPPSVKHPNSVLTRFALHSYCLCSLFDFPPLPPPRRPFVACHLGSPTWPLQRGGGRRAEVDRLSRGRPREALFVLPVLVLLPLFHGAARGGGRGGADVGCRLCENVRNGVPQRGERHRWRRQGRRDERAQAGRKGVTRVRDFFFFRFFFYSWVCSACSCRCCCCFFCWFVVVSSVLVDFVSYGTTAVR